MIQLQMIEQEVNQLSSQTQMIEQHIAEMEELKLSLDEIQKNESKDMLINIGKKIYVPVQIREKELVVEVGNKIYVKKSIKDTKDLANEQIEKLLVAKDQINARLHDLEVQMDSLVQEDSTEHSCGCSEDCECEEGHECDHENCHCKHHED